MTAVSKTLGQKIKKYEVKEDSSSMYNNPAIPTLKISNHTSVMTQQKNYCFLISGELFCTIQMKIHHWVEFSNSK